MSREHPRLPLHRPPLTGPASRSYSSYRHPQQMPHGQPEPGASYRYPLPPPSYPPLQHLPPETDPIVDNIVQRITQSTSQMIGASQAQSDARLNRLESMLQRITTDISSARQESRDCVVQIAEVLQKSHAIQLGRLKRLENILGMGPDIEDEKTLLNRFDLLSFAVEDLLERVKDPEANLPDGPLHHDMATSPAKRAYANAVIPPKTPSPKPQTASAAVGSSSPIAVFPTSTRHPLLWLPTILFRPTL
ncbi:hypothetical protein B0H17DRAFT_707312 [Mycena rosella]|uniref:Uncharacterized protein n=1 Tax=Mycena rosella TaxID=1033263 RepID=A0AAD7DA57_MYCRO|nr:hypothetical protein B0H17DRAFT_707312 [Mycena rosella]